MSTSDPAFPNQDDVQTNEDVKTSSTQQLEESSTYTDADAPTLSEDQPDDKSNERQTRKLSEEGPKTPPEDIKPSARPARKLAVLVSACVLVIALSAWGLAVALTPNDNASNQQDQSSSSQSATDENDDAAEEDEDAAQDEEDSADSGETESDEQTNETSSSSETSTTTTGSTGNNSGGTTGGNSGGTATGNQQPQAVTVSLTVSCSEARAVGDSTALAVSNESGLMVSSSVRLNAGSTVYDALMASGAAVGSNSSTFGMYIYSIGGLAEKIPGHPNSGWKFYVNGVAATQSSNLVTLNNGDSIEWRYALQA